MIFAKVSSLLFLAVVAASMTAAALPPLGPWSDRWVEGAYDLDVLVASDNPHIRFDTNKAFRSYMKVQGKDSLDRALT